MSQDIVRHHMALVFTQGKYFEDDLHLYEVLLDTHIWTLLAWFPIILVVRKSSSKKVMAVNKVWEEAIPNKLKTVFLCVPPTANLFRICIAQTECIMSCGRNSHLI